MRRTDHHYGVLYIWDRFRRVLSSLLRTTQSHQRSPLQLCFFLQHSHGCSNSKIVILSASCAASRLRRSQKMTFASYYQSKYPLNDGFKSRHPLARRILNSVYYGENPNTPQFRATVVSTIKLHVIRFYRFDNDISKPFWLCVQIKTIFFRPSQDFLWHLKRTYLQKLFSFSSIQFILISRRKKGMVGSSRLSTTAIEPFMRTICINFIMSVKKIWQNSCSVKIHSSFSKVHSCPAQIQSSI